MKVYNKLYRKENAMFKIGDKVEFPVTQSICANNELSAGAKLLIKTAHNRHQDYLIVRKITARNGMHEFHLGMSIDDYVYSTIFYACDLVLYGHSGLMFAPAVVGTSRVKCHCGKTHQLSSTQGVDHNIYRDYVDSSGWHIRLNKEPIRKPRGQSHYVYYVAYCPECWEIEKQRRQSAEAELPSILVEEPSLMQQIRSSMNISNSPGEAMRVPPQSVTWAIPVQQEGQTTGYAMADLSSQARDTVAPESPRQQITRPFSIWVHHKGVR
jgi:hypothetical protein